MAPWMTFPVAHGAMNGLAASLRLAARTPLAGRPASAGDCGDGHGVDEVVHGVVAVALDPAEGHLVLAGLVERDEGLPQVTVGDGLAL
jgi:hypothetical protein